MAKSKLPYTYATTAKLAGGRTKLYWRFRRGGRNSPLPGNPGEAAFLTRYAELMSQCEAEEAAANENHEPDRHTFEWLARAFLASADFEALSDKSQDDYRRTLEDRLIPALGPERFDCIVKKHVKAVRDACAKTHSVRTAHKVKQAASRLYSWADEEDLLPANFVNPGMGVKRLPGRSKSIEIWSDEEIALYLRHAPAAMQTPVMLALYTGQRREDLVKMEWSALQGNVIRVRQNKTGEPLTIPCHPVLARHLKKARTKFGGPILRGQDGGPMTANQLSAALRRQVARTPDMPHRSIHGLRYAAAGMLEDAGCSVVEISSLVGHRTYQMALKYARQRKDAETAVNRVKRP